MVVSAPGLVQRAGAVPVDGLVLDVVGDHCGERHRQDRDDEEQDPGGGRGDPSGDRARARDDEGRSHRQGTDSSDGVGRDAGVIRDRQRDLGGGQAEEAEPQQDPTGVRSPPPGGREGEERDPRHPQGDDRRLRRVIDGQRATEERGCPERREAHRRHHPGRDALEEQVGAQGGVAEPSDGHQEERELRGKPQLHLRRRHRVA